MKDETRQYFDNAKKNLSDANMELMRPEEDVVSMLVCKNAQMAIENYLKGYLSGKGINTEGLHTIDELFAQCVKVNPKFERVDLEDFNCTYLESGTRYCEEVSKVSRCYRIADSLDDFLRQERVIA